MAGNTIYQNGRRMLKNGGGLVAELGMCVAGPSRLPATTRSLHPTPAAPASSPSPATSSRKTLTEKELAAIEAEEEWARNLRQVRRWRRNQESIRDRLSHIKPPSSSSSSSSSSPRTNLLSTLLASGAALGHSPSLLHPSNIPLIYGTRAGISLIDLEQTVPLLRRAAGLVKDVVKADGVVLIVGTRQEHREMVKKGVERLEGNGFGVAGEKWLPGTLTNSYSYFGISPIRSRSNLPDLVIFLNPSENLSAIRECTASHVPTIGVCDTDMDLRGVTYGIPANMESLRTLELIVSTLTLAGRAGRELRIGKKVAQQEAARKY